MLNFPLTFLLELLLLGNMKISSISRCFSSSSILRRCSSGIISSHSRMGFSSNSGALSSMLEKLATWGDMPAGEREKRNRSLKGGLTLKWILDPGLLILNYNIKIQICAHLELREKFICSTWALVTFSCFSQSQDLINIHLLKNTKKKQWFNFQSMEHLNAFNVGLFTYCRTCGSDSSPSASLKSSSAPNLRIAVSSSLLNGFELWKECQCWPYSVSTCQH